MTWLPRTLDELRDPTRIALLVYDMQVGITRQIEGADAIIERCAVALEAARSSGMRVAFSRHLSSPKPWMGSTQYRTAMAWQRKSDPADVAPWFLRGSAAAEITPELAPRNDELVVDKLAMSAFEGTPLAFALHDCGVTGIAICGIALEIGIEPTIRHATDLGFVPILLADGCGAGDAAAGADALRMIRFIGEAIVTTVCAFNGALHVD
jgi:nicotinamidase-related amidase